MIQNVLNSAKYYLYFLFAIIFIITNCSNQDVKEFDRDKSIYSPKDYEQKKRVEREGSFITDLFNGDNNNNQQSINISVNQYLWKASLDILSSSVPLVSIDSMSGIIISDWYNLKNKPNERIKISILVTSRELRADGLNIKIFKQVNKGGNWVTSSINPQLALNLERKIVHKAGILANNNKLE